MRRAFAGSRRGLAGAVEDDHAVDHQHGAGDFGELVYAGMDWVDPVLAKRSMVLMAEEVMPRVNRAIGAG
jgi:hypothetical protein